MNTHRLDIIHTPWTIRASYTREAERVRSGRVPTHRKETQK